VLTTRNGTVAQIVILIKIILLNSLALLAILIIRQKWIINIGRLMATAMIVMLAMIVIRMVKAIVI
jgi:hypothetical protein